MKIFLSFNFDAGKARPEGEASNHDLARNVEELIRSHGMEVFTGERLGGGALGPEVCRLIEGSDALVALCTADKKLEDGRKECSDWVRDELGHARGQRIPAIALLEAGLERGGMYREHETIALDRGVPLPAFLALSRTLAQWKTLALKVEMLLPPDLVRLAADPNEKLECSYRLSAQGQYSSWQAVELIPELEGTFAYIHASSTEQGIQFMVRRGAQLWTSAVTPQRLRLVLEQRWVGGAGDAA